MSTPRAALATCLCLACGSRTSLATAPADAGADSGEDVPPPPPTIRLFTSSGLAVSPHADLFELPSPQSIPLPLPSATNAFAFIDMVRAGNRLYFADGSAGIAWFEKLSGTLDGPHVLWDAAATTLAFSPAMHTLYALAFTDASVPSTVMRFDGADSATATSAPSATFEVTVATAQLAADDGDRLYFVQKQLGNQVIGVLEHASQQSAAPSLYELPTPFSFSWPIQLAIGPTRFWTGGYTLQGLPSVGSPLAEAAVGALLRLRRRARGSRRRPCRSSRHDRARLGE